MVSPRLTMSEMDSLTQGMLSRLSVSARVLRLVASWLKRPCTSATDMFWKMETGERSELRTQVRAEPEKTLEVESESWGVLPSMAPHRLALTPSRRDMSSATGEM